MSYTKDFSVIIPVWRGAVKYLPKLIDSIPQIDGVEIIIVDNSKDPVRREEIETERDIIFLHSAYERHAGGSRNDGIAAANGKWLLFADADDFFSDKAFEFFYSKINSDADIIYTCAEGLYVDTGERSGRGDDYTNRVKGFLAGRYTEEDLRLDFHVPWCKMIKSELIKHHNICFDEIKAGNDMYFSLVSGYYANKIEANDVVTYVVTVTKGSLTKRRDYETIKARLFSKLHCNQFLKAHGYPKRQYSVMFALAESRNYGFKKTIEFILITLRYKQNPFIGISRWFKTKEKNKESINRDKSYYSDDI